MLDILIKRDINKDINLTLFPFLPFQRNRTIIYAASN